MDKALVVSFWEEAKKDPQRRVFFHKHFGEFLKTLPDAQNDPESDDRPGKRTDSQNKAMWRQHELVADELTKLGVTMRKVFEATTDFDIPPTKDNVHDLWLYFQRIMYPSMPSTKDLPKHGDHYSKIHDVMMKNLGEKFHCDYIDFPNDETKARPTLEAMKIEKRLPDYPEDIYNGKAGDFGDVDN